jgi:hypothetical protein
VPYKADRTVPGQAPPQGEIRETGEAEARLRPMGAICIKLPNTPYERAATVRNSRMSGGSCQHVPRRTC